MLSISLYLGVSSRKTGKNARISLYTCCDRGAYPVGYIQAINGLYNTHHQDSHHLISIFNDCFCHQGGIGTHAYNVLVVIVVGDAMHIHRIGQSLTFCRGRGGCELGGLQTIIQPQYSHIDKGGGECR